MFEIAELCSVILDTGYMGTPAEYLKAYHNKDVDELTPDEIKSLTDEIGKKRGWLWELEEEAKRDTL